MGARPNEDEDGDRSRESVATAKAAVRRVAKTKTATKVAARTVVAKTAVAAKVAAMKVAGRRRPGDGGEAGDGDADDAEPLAQARCAQLHAEREGAGTRARDSVVDSFSRRWRRTRTSFTTRSSRCERRKITVLDDGGTSSSKSSSGCPQCRHVRVERRRHRVALEPLPSYRSVGKARRLAGASEFRTLT